VPAYSFGDVILVPFPFTDQTGNKKRPAVIVSNAAYNLERRDVVIMAITSRVRPAAAHEALVEDWQAVGLLRSSVMKPVITTIEQSLIIKRLGTLSARDQAALRKIIGAVLC
jgi:mRNA interferase MazF